MAKGLIVIFFGIPRAMEEYGKIDIIICNKAISPSSYLIFCVSGHGQPACPHTTLRKIL